MMASHVDISIRVPLNSSSVDSSLCQSSNCPLLHRPSSVPVSTQPLSFSISRILGLEDDSFHPSSHSLLPACGNSITESGKASVNDKSRQGCDHSPSVDSDNPSTDVDSGRESDNTQSSPVSARPKKIMKKKQRTTFSPLEVLELEKVFAQRPYLMPEDEDELVQKLGITPRNVRFWFQNRRAKLRRQERAPANVPQTSLPNQFDQFPPPPAPYRKLQFGSSFYSFNAAGFQRTPQFPRHISYSLRNFPAYPPEHAPCPCCPVRSNQFPLAEIDSPAKQEDYMKFPLCQFAEPSAVVERIPRFHSNHLDKLSDNQQRSRDYL